MNSKNTQTPLPSRIFWITIGGASLILVIYTILHLLPVSADFQQNRDVGLSFLTALIAAIDTWLAIRIWLNFKSTEPPYGIWRAFALGLGAWTCAELIWTLYLHYYGSAMPEITPGDLFWMVGYIGLGTALVLQYRELIRVPSKRLLITLSLGAALFLTLTFGITAVLINSPGIETSWWGTFISVFYPLADLALALSALLLALTLSNAQWARPWLALFFFTISDLIFTWLFTSNSYIYSGDSNLGTIITDVLYIASYLLLMLALLAQFLLLRYGIRWLKPRKN